MSFAQLNLNPSINKAIQACGYTTPTPVQAQSIPVILERKDLVASAQTGTGKTAAFVLPALHYLAEQTPTKKTRILILTPTRELASQITKAAATYGKFLRYNIVSLVGGMPYGNQIRDLARGADIIVATPGRLMDHIEQKRVDLSHVDMLVLDEADRMLDMGFIEDVEFIAKLTPSKRQTLLFSATVDKQLTTVVRHLLKNPVRIDLSSEVLAAPKIKQEMYKVNSPQQKMKLLKHILTDGNIFKAIIFTATKIMADKIASQLRYDGMSADALHGDLRQNVRNRTVESLRRGKIQFLVATDVAARGIDISDITHVFNYDMPRFCEDYVHRIGRTGRAGKTGIAISFVMPSDSRHVQRIERFIGQRLQFNHQVNVNALPASKTSNDSDESPAGAQFSDDRDFNRDNERPRKKFSSERTEGRRSFDKDDRNKSAAREGFRSRTAADGGRSRRDDAGNNFRSKSSHERTPFNNDGFRGRKSANDGESGGGGYRSRNLSSEDGRSRRTSSFDQDDRGNRSEGGFRGKRSSEGGRAEGGFRGKRSSEGDRGSRAQGGFRGKRNSEGDRSDRSEGGFRGKRSSEGDRGGRAEGGFRGKRGSEGSRDRRPSSEGNRVKYTNEGGRATRATTDEGSRGHRSADGFRAKSSEGGRARKSASGDGYRSSKPAAKDGKRPFKKRAPSKRRDDR